MADFSGINSTIDMPSGVQENEVQYSYLSNSKNKNKKNMNQVQVNSKIMKILRETEQEYNQQEEQNQHGNSDYNSNFNELQAPREFYHNQQNNGESVS